MQPNLVSICIVNYKTEELTRLCLRSIRKFTSHPYEVIVIDNGSNDSSVEYLRTLPWIKLIERTPVPDETGGWAHGRALDAGLAAATGEYFLVMHSDTIIHREGWLKELVANLKDSPRKACAGGGKLDLKPKWRILLKKYTDVKAWLRKLKANAKPTEFYIRTLCALYRTKVLKDEKLSFIMKMEEGVTCGKQLYYELLGRGYETVILPPEKMATFIHHLAHATMVLNPEFKVRKRTEKQCKAALEALLNSPLVTQTLADQALDQ